jgi:hypothetical protein
MAGRRHRGNEEKEDKERRRPGPDTLEERIGKAVDSGISPYIKKNTDKLSPWIHLFSRQYRERINVGL